MGRKMIEPPEPMLTYHYWLAEADPVRLVLAQGPALYDVREVTVSKQAGHGPFHVRVIARGSMRKRNGERGPRRSVMLDPDAKQPDWAQNLIIDAHDRLWLG